MTHGGKRPSAGRPATPLDERRLMVLIGQCCTQREIAGRFGVSQNVIAKRVTKLKQVGLNN